MDTWSIILVVAILAGGFILPIIWLLRGWLEERQLEAPLALAAIAAHIAIFSVAVMWEVKPGVAYSALAILFLAFSSRIRERWDRRAQRTLANEDILRWRRLLERDPKNAAVHAALGDACLAAGAYADAIAAYEQAIALDPINSRNELPKLDKARAALAAAEAKKTRKNMPAE